MLSPKQLLLSIAIFLFLSCNNDLNYTFAIKDIRKPLRPHLTKIVTGGIVWHSDSALRNMATDKELLQLSQSEHPMLRASALREILHRESFDHFDILMKHLNDTAIVSIDRGEFGIWFRTVSDDIVQRAGWKTKEAKDKTIERVLTKHNYLRSAYLILLSIEAQEKYYPFIKDMATRPRRLSYDGYELAFDDIEYALYGLAKYKKKEDVKIIKEQLMKHDWQLSDISFRLMKEFPDTAYLEVLQSYHRRRFYRFSGDDRNGFTGNDDIRASSTDFIEALASQQNNTSAQIFDTILQRLPAQTCLYNKKDIENEVIMQIWEHPNPAYSKLREKIKARAEQISKRELHVPMNSYTAAIDTTKENIRW